MNLIILLLIVATGIQAQDKTRIYSVLYKGDNVGTLQVTQRTSGDTVHYKMTSDVRTRVLFRITVKSVEESTFQRGRLIYSAVNRVVNGNEKGAKLTRAGNNYYTVTAAGKSSLLKNETIAYNLMRLYCVEPQTITKVYSDNYQQFLPIVRIKPHTYKVVLPDGNYNYYTYTNGICSKVEVFNSLYNMEMILRDDR